MRFFCEDAGATVWVTFVGESLYWGFADDSPVAIWADNAGICRQIRGSWRQTDVTGEALTKDRLSGAVTKLAAYRGTSCAVDVAEYVVRRINGHRLPAVERALGARQEMRAATRGLMRLLTPQDFELLWIWCSPRADDGVSAHSAGRRRPWISIWCCRARGSAC